MLISFSVANFRSFGEEVTLNMVASNKLSDHENHLVPIGDTGRSALRTSIVYGANAAGKSNLVRAIEFAQRMVCGGTDGPRFATPFGFGAEWKTKPSSFEFRFLVDTHVFIYGFDIMGNRFVGEWLSLLTRGDNEVALFNRNEQDKVTIEEVNVKRFFGSDVVMRNTLDILSQIPLRPDQLFLKRVLSLPDAAQGKTMLSIIRWFTKTLLVLPVESRWSGLFDRLQNDERFTDFCSRFLSNVGTGVGRLNLLTQEREGQEWEKHVIERMATMGSRYKDPFFEADSDIIEVPDNPGMVIERKLLSEHHISPNKYHLPFSEESDGTQSLLHLMPILASPPDESLVVVIDELDRSLHPLICWEFVRFFSESCLGAHRQLIVTTHEAHLLNQELLRRDEYWFAEKDARQQTQLTSLIDFKIRSDLKVDKGYLNGRFGAIPLIGGMHELERLLECGNEGEAGNATEASST